MADKIDVIPDKTRWEISTKGLTGAYIALSNAFKQVVGRKKFEEFNGPLWYGRARERRSLRRVSDWPQRRLGTSKA